MRRIVSAALLVTLLAGCTKTGTSVTATGSTPSHRGILRIAISSDVKNLNPLLGSFTSDVMIARLMFEPLVSANPQGVSVPILAVEVPSMENRGISADGLQITYHLRKNARWTDGQPVTSEDVKWTWQAIMNGANNIISRHGYDDVASIDTPDPKTAVIHLKQKFAPFVNTFFADSDQPYPVMPSHVLARYPNINSIPFDGAPTVSDGPFKFKRWFRGDHIELTANDDFFLGKPGLAGITIRTVANDETALNLLRTHDIDWVFEESVSNYPSASKIPGTRLAWADVNGYEDLQLNVQRPLLRDVRVRQALAYAIDKQRLIQTITYGQERIATEDQPTFMWSYDPNVKSYPYDPQKARQLLLQAGWTPGPDGIMTKNGTRLSLLTVTNINNATRRREILLIQEMAHEAGIELVTKEYQSEVLFAPVGEGGILQGGKFDLSLAGWYSGVDPDDSSQLTCKNVAPNGYNYSRYCNPDMEAAQKAALEHYDLPSRKAAYFRIQELLARDVPEIYTYYQRQMHPVSTAFKGFEPNPSLESWNAWQWSI